MGKSSRTSNLLTYMYLICFSIIIVIIIIIIWSRYSIPREEKLCYAKTKYEN